MQVILLERIERLGQMGDEVAVKPGYARNFLIPQKKALRATAENRKQFEARRAELEALNLQRRQEAEQVAAKMEGLSLVMIRQAGDTGQLYGSVTARDVALGLAEKDLAVERSQIALDHQIKVLGLHTVTLRLHPEVSVDILVNVARSAAEAEVQAEAGRTVSVEEQQRIAEEANEELLEEMEEVESVEDGEETGAEEEERA